LPASASAIRRASSRLSTSDRIRRSLFSISDSNRRASSSNFVGGQILLQDFALLAGVAQFEVEFVQTPLRFGQRARLLLDVGLVAPPRLGQRAHLRLHLFGVAALGLLEALDRRAALDLDRRQIAQQSVALQ
jgi:hypothetical protein